MLSLDGIGELGIRGGAGVKILVSGGLGEQEVLDLKEWVDGFGIGTSVSTAPVIDFGGKIVEIEGSNGEKELISKRGDLSGRKYVYRDESTMTDMISLDREPPSRKYRSLIEPLMKSGKIVRKFRSIDELKERTKRLVKAASAGTPHIVWQQKDKNL